MREIESSIGLNLCKGKCKRVHFRNCNSEAYDKAKLLNLPSTIVDFSISVQE